MTAGRLSLFDSPLFLGFDHFEKTFDRLRKTAQEGYPPYNIEHMGDNALRITLAVAGFGMDDLDIEVENNQLVIRGKQSEEEGRTFIHRGIAARQFQRAFVLADGIEVQSAFLDNGLLHIDLIRLEPEVQARKIAIRAPGKPESKLISGNAEEAAPDKNKKNK
ncbi:MAG: Hsp20 family protein [Alphaproteobacteria bacterium]|nr:Hsp20 family protein [Alphaproteobacteria bacterium]MCD8519838.1 Hsp20 family protein [Alphaproteobacteria bacterium]MCD8526484.1 Hsp20 family protein [Alphaproteobacteria bacterium]MCD8570375.1 Hsp20 family protein [Alphaproteobacteria bacterium]